ncbi:hypothetical protein D7X55_01315 [Corallococcus sp. AB049A]|uniref:hypothetical protein n=1 Tax=Corallococcus sp. AB049A TaxID=2316721 RepID=UPI000EE3F158|nr:hypothetical protein [Corallococcus sp. AB049A]RKI74846.1 hypothetical protein D7X55_01315 [Corallococcus sp. AB049A]
MSHPVWTLALDESGRFEQEPPQDEVLVIGGVLCPGEVDRLAAPLERALRQACKAEGIDKWPPHASELPREVRGRILEVLSRELTRLGGCWIFLVEPPSGRADTRLATYVRMLADVVDISARLAVLQGARELDVRPATRTLPLMEETAQAAARRGIALPLEALEKDGEPPRRWVRSYTEAEVRQTLDGLARESSGQLGSWPSLRSIEVDPGRYGGAHPAVFLSDFACNFLHGLLGGVSGKEAVTGGSPLDPDGKNPPLVIARAALKTLRGVDRALREDTVDLWQASALMETLAGDVRGQTSSLSRYRAAREGALLAASQLWERACRVLGADLKVREAMGVGVVLSGRSQGALAAKTGDYEGTWRAIEAGWSGEGALAKSVRRALAGERESAARLWRQTLECANHRGDISAGTRAASAFRELLVAGLSFGLLAERQQMLNLEQVMLQNRLPADAPELASCLGELASSAEALVRNAEEDGEILTLAIHQPVPPTLMDARERALAEALGQEPGWDVPDRERGRMFGTAARSLAFCGRAEEAIRLALRARRYFLDSPMDLRMNATILARMLLERVRLSGADADMRGISESFELAGVGEIRKPAEAAGLVKREPGMRFTLDLILRALLWAPGCVPRGDWPGVLEERGPKSLFGVLASGTLRSHPSELIARHAGELLARHDRPSAAREWFGLSCELCQGASEGSALRRLGVFTERLATSSCAVPEGPLGSLLNPSFEYR